MEFQKERPDFANSEMFVHDDVELEAEELEEVVAPGCSPNHNEIFAVDVS